MIKSALIFASGVAVVLAPFALAQRLTTDDPNYSSLSQLADGIGWYQDSQTKAWVVADGKVDQNGSAVCMVDLDKIRASGAPDTRKIEIRWEGPEMKPGLHTLAEIRSSCEHLERLGKIKKFEFWAVLAMQEAPKVNSGRSDAAYFRNCIQTYNKIVAGGVPPSERVPERVIAGTPWSGTIEELKQKWCDTGLKTAHGNSEAHEAPFRKELQGDKLKIALKYGSVFLPGGVGTADPHKMAEASVWFVDFSPSKVCVNGLQVHTLRRYQFGPAQQILSSTERNYCGKAPRSAFQ
jgi:hypothetical protein